MDMRINMAAKFTVSRTIPAGGFVLLPELLESLIPHVLESEDVGRSVILQCLLDRAHNSLLVLLPLLLGLRQRHYTRREASNITKGSHHRRSNGTSSESFTKTAIRLTRAVAFGNRHRLADGLAFDAAACRGVLRCCRDDL
ncbi:hypothetical protein BHE74_00035338 [Ensete ventricosum]|nr:hypothetical protein GW17_00043959 [Ensete ventricosum]RWW57843.1 hypothetical protein BHE74_00035338 [Ensete ventricosum]RZS12063.1 hypothetical protein BHM03_00043448 [Ensete ventricosum]